MKEIDKHDFIGREKRRLLRIQLNHICLAISMDLRFAEI
jgi:hypothetical protein